MDASAFDGWYQPFCFVFCSLITLADETSNKKTEKLDRINHALGPDGEVLSFLQALRASALSMPDFIKSETTSQ
jgi:hypothetical protein